MPVERAKIQYSVHTTTKWFFSGMPLIRWKSRSDEGPMLEMPAFKSLYAGQFTSSTQLLKSVTTLLQLFYCTLRQDPKQHQYNRHTCWNRTVYVKYSSHRDNATYHATILIMIPSQPKIKLPSCFSMQNSMLKEWDSCLSVIFRIL